MCLLHFVAKRLGSGPRILSVSVLLRQVTDNWQVFYPRNIEANNDTSKDLPVVDAITIRIEAEKEYPLTSKSRASQDR
jgi:hypothetical protein